ncbi:two-component system response regulator [Thiosulfativibrio zosterae]|uniref:Two-component system response regulator n=2 Tax=Thiosulfativibrio zosterae TaxID=2675053 RepID=A0A6F8PQD6_9GAMM|nr:two-component system response regulator [Thiosulfativibrio zosterae]
MVTRLTLTKILQKTGYQVIQAENGQLGFSRFCEEKPALILMDVMMPVMDGYAATQAIRNYETGQATPIIMLTALEDMESIDHAFNAGATDFITKPINWGLLGQRLKYALKASKTEEELRSSQVHLNYALRLAKLGYWEWDATKDSVNGSNSAFELMGVPAQEDMPIDMFISKVAPKDMPLLQQAISDAQRGESHVQVSFRVMHPNQNLLHIDCLGDASYDKEGKLIKITGSAQDISRLHKAESIIDYQANHDSLTDLANRSYFNKYLQNLIESNASAQISALSATIVLDIDRFKIINDNLGQNNGDLLLMTLANRLKKVTREDDFVARLGSDEFAIVIKHAHSLAELNLSLNRIFNDLSRPYLIGDQELFITFSFGVAIVHQDGKTANHLLANANVARAQAKALGGNQFALYQKDMNQQAKSQLLLENDLYKALERNEIEVYFQPQVDAKTLKPYGAEALVRWNHAKQGLISPVQFIPIAESTGLIIEIGQFIIRKAVEETEKWHKMGYDHLHIGINLSGRQFANDNLMDVIQNVLSHSTLPAKFLDFEITESLAMSNADHNISVLKGLKALGVSLSIDDFGTGYSSLAYLHSFPIDTIKIDRSFIINLETTQGQAIVNTILAMANSLGLEVVAEGIEDDFHVSYLQSRNCDIFQGFKFGKPMTSTDFTRYLAENAK